MLCLVIIISCSCADYIPPNGGLIITQPRSPPTYKCDGQPHCGHSQTNVEQHVVLLHPLSPPRPAGTSLRKSRIINNACKKKGLERFPCLSLCPPLSAEDCQGLPVLEVRQLVGVEPGREGLDEGNDGRVASSQPLLPLLLPLLPDNGGPEHP